MKNNHIVGENSKGAEIISSNTQRKEGRGMWCNMKRMIRERRAWLVARGIERRTDHAPAPRQALIDELLEKYPHLYKDQYEASRAIQASVPRFALWREEGLETLGKGDDYFSFLISWNRIMNETGIWGLIATVLSIVGIVVAIAGIITAIILASRL